MTPAEALDLVPLYAGDDLDDETREALQTIIDTNPDVAAELLEFEELEGLLKEHLAPMEAAPAWLEKLSGVPTAPQPAERSRVGELVRRQCPYCKDALEVLAVVFCSRCATPHHETCFAENRGCSLLGCEGVESVTTQTETSRICDACEKHTPSVAPFCAWCGAAMDGESAPPRHHRKVTRLAPPGGGLLRFLAAAALLLSAGLGVGALVGYQQKAVLETLKLDSAGDWRMQTSRAARQFLLEVVVGQRYYRDQIGAGRYCENLERLSLALASHANAGDDDVPFLNPKLRKELGYDYEISLSRSPDGARFYLLLRDNTGNIPSSPAYFVNHTGVVRELTRGVYRIDPVNCKLVSKKEKP